MIGRADCKFRPFDAAKRMEVQIWGGFGGTCRIATTEWTVATGVRTEVGPGNAMPPRRRSGFRQDDRSHYFFAGTCGWDGGTVSISLPENTGAEVG